MEPLPLIPTPSGQKWREFRIRFLPLLVFACTCGGIFYIWREHVTPPTLVAHVEPIVSEVRAASDCVISNLFVEAHQTVRKGDRIAEIVSIDDRRLDAQLQRLRSQISLMQLEIGTLVDRERLAFDYFSSRVGLLDQQRDLRGAEAELPHALYNVNLASNLVKNGVLSDFDYHAYLSRYEILKTDIAQLTQNVAELEKSLEQLKAASQVATTDDPASSLQQLLLELANQRKQLDQLATSTTLITAPADGVVTLVHRRSGENVLSGEPIVSISASQGTHIVGYLRQPLSVDPESGMPCQIRTRAWKRFQAEAIITAVGAQWVVVTNIALLRPDALPELGLPVSIEIPDTLRTQLRPGELVDVTVRPK